MNLRATIRALFGADADSAGQALSETQTAAPETGDRAQIGHLRRELAEHPVQGLTPARLYQILEEAEAGDLKRQHELAADMEERDPQIQSDIGKRRLAAAECDWEVVAPPEASRAEQAAAEQAQEILGGLEPSGEEADSGMEDLIIQLGEGILHGWVNLALPWATDGNSRILRQPQWVPHSHFRLHPDDQDQLTLRGASRTGEPLWPLGWVKHRHRAKSGYVARMGLLRVLCWPFLFQNYALGDLAELLEILGIPVRLGKYPARSATREERNTLLRAVSQMGHSAAGIIPDSMSVELLEAASGSEKPFETMLQWCERSKSKAILGGTLTTGTEQGSGAYALGQVHERGLQSLVNSDLRQYAASIRVYMLWPMAALNYGITDLRRAPRLVFDTRDPADLKLLAESLPPLVSMGMQIPVRWAHQELRIPEPQPDEPVLRSAAASQETASGPAESPAPAALSALTETVEAQQSEPPTPADQLTEQALSESQPHIGDWVAQLETLAAQAESLEELRGLLIAAYGRLPTEAVAAGLEQLRLAAHAAGRADLEGQSE